MLNLISFQASTLGALGQLALLAALAFTLGGTWLAVVGGLRADARATEAARRAVWAVFGLVSLASLVLMTALLGDDFSVRYVAEHSMRASPTWVKVTSLWGALEGSILLWAWLLGGFAFLPRGARLRCSEPVGERSPDREPARVVNLMGHPDRGAGCGPDTRDAPAGDGARARDADGPGNG